MASKRGYTTTDEVNELAGISTATDLQINEAEEIIDEYVGYIEKFLRYEIKGLAAAGGSSSLTLQTDQQNIMQKNYLRGCWVEIIGGTGEGQRRKISAQTLAGVLTVETAFTTSPDNTSYYRIWQLGKFPRHCDVQFDGVNTPNQYFKFIPEKVRRATAAQVEFMINMGEKFFGSDSPDMNSENIGDYSYSKGGNSSSNKTGVARLIAPKAKLLLRGILVRTGSII